MPFTIVKDLIDKVLVASEKAIWDAVYALLELSQLVVEGSGAAAVAPLLAGPASGYETELELKSKKGGTYKYRRRGLPTPETLYEMAVEISAK